MGLYLILVKSTQERTERIIQVGQMTGRITENDLRELFSLSPYNAYAWYFSAEFYAQKKPEKSQKMTSVANQLSVRNMRVD